MTAVCSVHRIEACAGDLKEKLLKLFEVLYMTPKVSLEKELGFGVS